MLNDIPDIVYVYKRGENDDELRYSLRSLKNIPHGTVFISGDCPGWAKNIVHIPSQDYSWAVRGNPWLDQEAKWRAAVECNDVSENFLAFNDDFFIMKPLSHMPNIHRGRLKHSGGESFPQAYRQMLDRTSKYLTSVVTSTPINYEVHAPMLMNKHKRLIISVYLEENMRKGTIYAMRSIYGNVFNIGGRAVEDYKNPSGIWAQLPFLSTTEESFQGELGEFIKSKFPDKGIYEL